MRHAPHDDKPNIIQCGWEIFKPSMSLSHLFFLGSQLTFIFESPLLIGSQLTITILFFLLNMLHLGMVHVPYDDVNIYGYECIYSI